MESKNTIILIESVVLVILLGFLIYGYNKYSELNGNYKILIKENEMWTDFRGIGKVQLPINEDYEALTAALNSEEYDRFITPIVTEIMMSKDKEPPKLMYHVTWVRSDDVNQARQKEPYNWIPDDVGSSYKGLYVVKLVVKESNEPIFPEYSFNLYINPKNGEIIKGIRQKFDEDLLDIPLN